MNNEIMEQLRRWTELKKQLVTLGEEEYVLREPLAQACMAGKNSGSKTSRWDSGTKVKASIPFNYRLDRPAFAAISDQLTDADWEAIDMKPTIKPSKFDKLPYDSVLRTVVTVAQGKLQFEVVESVG